MNPRFETRKRHKCDMKEDKLPTFRVQKLSRTAIVPRRATLRSAGYDLYSAINKKCTSGYRVTIPLDIKMAIKEGYAGIIKSRSGLAAKGIDAQGGVIDSDYRGPVSVILANATEKDYYISKGERIAQLLIIPVVCCPPVIVTDLEGTIRGDGGFGSTGR